MYLAIDSGGNVSDLVVALNWCMARMFPGEAELVSEWTGLSGRAKSITRFERSKRLDTALYKNHLYLLYSVFSNNKCNIDQLKECGLTTLETRRVRGDQIEVVKILNGYENIDSNIFFEIKESKITRGHNFTLVKKQSRLDVRKFSFSQRTINVWNQLSTECVHASSVNMFKNRIDKYVVKTGYT